MHSKINKLYAYLKSNGFYFEALEIKKLADDGGAEAAVANKCSETLIACHGPSLSEIPEPTKVDLKGGGMVAEYISWIPDNSNVYDALGAWLPSKGDASGKLTITNPKWITRDKCDKTKLSLLTGKISESIEDWIGSFPQELRSFISGHEVGAAICSEKKIEWPLTVKAASNVPEGVRVCFCFEAGDKDNTMHMYITADTFDAESDDTEADDKDSDFGTVVDVDLPRVNPAGPAKQTPLEEAPEATFNQAGIKRMVNDAVKTEWFDAQQIADWIGLMQKRQWSYQFYFVPDGNSWVLENHSDMYRAYHREGKVKTLDSVEIDLAPNSETKKYYTYLEDKNITWVGDLINKYNAPELLANAARSHIFGETWEVVRKKLIAATSDSVKLHIQNAKRNVMIRQPNVFLWPVLFEIMRELYIENGGKQKELKKQIQNAYEEMNISKKRWGKGDIRTLLPAE